MSEQYSPELIIDPEFRDLIRPLMKEEYRQLESNIISDGCREPLTVWNDIIVDGHNRYEICRRLNLPYSVIEKTFRSREEAVAWICADQLGRRNISEETRKYLIGKRYEVEKTLGNLKNAKGWNQYMPQDDDDGLPYELYAAQSIPNVPASERSRTADKLAAEYHIAHGTVEKYGAYSKAIDRIAQREPDMLTRILSGRYKISHENVVELSKMSEQEIKKYSRNMLIQKRNRPFVNYGTTRMQLSGVLSQESVVLETSIKNMPEYDPDAEVTGLTLTIPSWINSIERMKSNADLRIISSQARDNLSEVLKDLLATIDELLLAIKE